MRLHVSTFARAALLLAALCTVSPGCATNPPPGTYSPGGQRAYDATQLLKDVDAVGATARNLNALQGADHLSDKDTGIVRDVCLVVAAGLNAWGSGAATLSAFKVSLDTLQLPAASALALARSAVDQAIVDHGASASVLYIVVDVYHTLRSKITVGPKLAVVLGVVDAGIAQIPLS